MNLDARGVCAGSGEGPLRHPPLAGDEVARIAPVRIGKRGPNLGEGGSNGAPPAYANAIADELSPLGVKVTRLPLSPSQIVALLDR